jgi:protein-S-isoprenylcysteine O-methyltransferase Ste14
MESNQADRADVAFPPPIVLLILIALGFAGRWLDPVEFLRPVWPVPIGLPIVVASLGFFAWAIITMRSEGGSIPTGKPTEAIVRKGPYKLSRNPIYLSMVVLLVGIGFWANSAWFLALAVLDAALLTWGVILPEERYLERKFGDSYVTYKRQVRRWI